MVSVRQILLNGRDKKVIRWSKNDPAWKEFISLVGDHVYRRSLNQEKLDQLARFSGLFNCISNKQMQEIVKEYPDLELKQL